MPTDGVPSRSNATDVASILASAVDEAGRRRGAGARRPAACTSMRRNGSAGGRLDHTAAACLVTYQPSAVVSPMSSGRARSDVDHRRDPVRGVVVDRSAREAEPAGDGERPAVVGADAERVAADLHRRREARVEVEVRDVVDADAGRRERGRAGGRDRGRLGERPPFGDEPVVVRLGRGVQEHHAVVGDAGGARRLVGTEQHAPRPGRRRCWRTCASGTGSTPRGCRARSCGSPRASTRRATTRAGCRPRPRRTATTARSRAAGVPRRRGRAAPAARSRTAGTPSSARPRGAPSRTRSRRAVVADHDRARRIVARLPLRARRAARAGRASGCACSRRRRRARRRSRRAGSGSRTRRSGAAGCCRRPSTPR